MKSTVVDESLSYYKTNVLFQRILQDFNMFVLFEMDPLTLFHKSIHGFAVQIWIFHVIPSKKKIDT